LQPLPLGRSGLITSKREKVIAEAIEAKLLSLNANPQAAKSFATYFVRRETADGWGAEKLQEAVAGFTDAGGFIQPQEVVDNIEAINESQRKEVQSIANKVMDDIKQDPDGKNLSKSEIANLRDLVENQIAPELIRFHGAFSKIAGNASALNDGGSVGLSSGRTININAASLLQKTQQNQFSNTKAIELTISEEVGHISHQIVLAQIWRENNPDSPFDEFNAALAQAGTIWMQLPKELQDHVTAIYGKTDQQIAGFEFLRMLLQRDIAFADGKIVSADGTIITEQTFPIAFLEGLKNVFKRVFEIFSELKTNIASMLKSEGVSDVEIAQTVSLVDRARKESFDIYNNFRRLGVQARQQAYDNERDKRATAKQKAKGSNTTDGSGIRGNDSSMGSKPQGSAPSVTANTAGITLDTVAKARLAELEAADAERKANEQRAKSRRSAIVQQNTGDIANFEETINSAPEDARVIVANLMTQAVAGEQKAVLGVNFEKIPASYIALPPGIVQTSHVGANFTKNSLYGGENTRAYEKDEAEQNKVRAGALPGALNEEILTSTDPSSANASPQIAIVIDNDVNGQPRARWQTAGGNAREMMTNLSPLQDQERLSATWQKKSNQFGFGDFPEGYRGYRFLGVHDIRSPMGATAYQKLVDNLNPSTGVVQDTYDRADLDAVKIPIERLAKLSVTMSGNTAMDELAALMRDAEAIGLERNRLAPMVKNPAQSQVYMQRLILGAAFKSKPLSNLYSELVNTNKSAAMVGLIADASRTALAVRAAGNNGVADALGSLLNNVGNYILTGSGLKSALKLAAGQIESVELVGDTSVAVGIAERLRDLVVFNKQGRIVTEATQDAWRDYLDSLARSIKSYDPNAWFDAPKSISETIIAANDAHKVFVERQKLDASQIQARSMPVMSNPAKLREFENKQASEELTPLEREEYNLLLSRSGVDFMGFYADTLRENSDAFAVQKELGQRGIEAKPQQLLEARPAPSPERNIAAQNVLDNISPEFNLLNDLIAKLNLAGGKYNHKIDGDFRSNWKITREGMLLRSPTGELFVTEQVKEGVATIAPLKGGASIKYNLEVAERLFDYQLTETEKEVEPEFISILTEYAKIKKTYDQTLNSIASNMREAYTLLPPLKGAPRAFEKIAGYINDSRKKGKSIEAFDAIMEKGQDFLRATIVVDSKDDIKSVVSETLRYFAEDVEYASSIKEIKQGKHNYKTEDGRVTLVGDDRFAVPLPSGYCDINIKIEVGPRMFAELQIHIPEILVAKQGWLPLLPEKYTADSLGVPDGIGHVLYEELRSSNDSVRIAELNQLSEELYKNALNNHSQRVRSSATANRNSSQETIRTNGPVTLGKSEDGSLLSLPGSTFQAELPSNVWKEALGMPSSSQKMVSSGNVSRFRSPSNGISPLVIPNKNTTTGEDLQQEKTPIDKIVFLASQIARKAHKNQFRRDGVTPYIEHIKATVARLASADPKIQAAAWLHDTIEDSKITPAQLIERGIPEEIVDAVVLLTKNKQGSYRDYITGIQSNEIATKVKLADMMSNLADDPSPRQIEKYTQAIDLLSSPNAEAGATAKKMIYARKRKDENSGQLGFDDLLNSVRDYNQVLEKDGITEPAEKIAAAMTDLNTNAKSASEMLFDFGLTDSQNNDTGNKPNADEIQRGRDGSTTRGDDRSAEAGNPLPRSMGDLFQFMAEQREAKRDSGMDEGRGGPAALDGLEGSQPTFGSDALRAERNGDADRVVSGMGDGFDGRGNRPGDAVDATGNESGEGFSGSSDTGIIKDRPPVGSPERNFSFTRDEKLAPKGAKGKFRANLAAIKTIKTIETERRLATPEEKQSLARFTGWGSVPQVFDDARAEQIEGGAIDTMRSESAKLRRYAVDYPNSAEYYRPEAEKLDQDATTLQNWKDQWLDSYQELKSLLTPEEYLSAKKSTINAHYTSPEIIAAMWDIVDKLGFKGGNVLEPGAGIGHFFGLMPENMADTSILFGVELDNFTSRILKALYPEATIQNTGFQTADIADGSIDLEISNVPFANVPVIDKGLEMMGGPVDNLHDYFFGKGLTKLKPGGLQVFISSAFTLDKMNSDNRRWLADKADLVAAYRLPNDAFVENAGTQVTTDIIVLRKKDGQGFYHGNDFVNLGDSKTAKGEGIRVNQYFANHPQNILGNLSLDGSMYGDSKEMTVESDPNRPVPIALAQALESLPENIVSSNSANNTKVLTGRTSEFKIGSIIEENGSYYFQGQESPDVDLNKAKNRGIVRDFIAVRDLLNTQYDLELDVESSDRAIEENRVKLNRAYDTFVFRNKSFHHRSNSSLLLDDPDYTRVLGSEVEKSRTVGIGATIAKLASALKGDKEFVKADIYSKRIMMPRVQPTKADSVADALGISLGWKGRVDLPYIAGMTGLKIEQAEKALLEGGMVVRDPETSQVLTREQYLSGNVRKKLAVALESGTDYERNVEMLQTVQPQDVSIEDVRFKIGATWIPAETYKEFLKSIGIANVQITYNPGVIGLTADGWQVDARRAVSRGVEYKDYQTKEIEVVPILNALLNFRRIAIYKRDETKGADSKPILSESATSAAKAAAKKLNDRFVAWVKETPEVAERLAGIYNKEVNAFAQRTYDGQFLQFPWANKDFDIYPDKKNTIWRAIQEGYGLLAHGVGGGKTILGSAIALEMRRLGMARKPMIVVHNATLESFAKEMAKMAPAARVLVGRKDELQGSKRREFLMRIAAGDWDAVVIAHSTFDLIADDPKVEADNMKVLIDAMTASVKGSGYASLQNAKEDKQKPPTVKNAIKQIETLEVRLKELSERKTDDGILNFQQLGVDALIVDEVHRFKKMPFNTKLDAKGIDGTFSKRGYALLMRARKIQEKMGGKNIFTMTGTPVTNTLGEIWNMIRLVAPGLVKEYGIESFDQFVSKFAEIEQASEMTPSGDHKMVDRLSKVVNLPEWATLLRMAADVKLGEDLIVKNRPEIKGGKPELVAVERTAGASKWVSYIRDVLKEFEGITGKEISENPSLLAVPVQAYMASRAAAIDIRMIQPDAIDETGSKVNVMVERLMEIYNRTNDYQGTQVVFADSFNQIKTSLFDSVVPLSRLDLTTEGSGKVKFNLYDDIKAKLIARGIPENEIALITDSKYSNPKVKNALFDQVNEGKVRVIIGSTESLGTGVNMQQRMAAAHHLDVPWTPAGLEQRDGRVYRQGNIHGEMGIPVEIVRYGMKDTLDAALWQKLETKQKFITLALSGKVVGRELEESQEILSLAEQRAVLSGPFGQKIFELENKIRELELERSGHFKEASNRQKEIESAQRGMQILLRKARDIAPSMQAMTGLAETIGKNGVRITVGGVEFKTKTELASAVDSELKSATERLARDSSIGDMPLHIRSISVNGQPVLLTGKMIMKPDMVGTLQPSYSFELANSEGDLQDGITFGRVTSFPTLASRLEELGETIDAIKTSQKNNAERVRQLAEMKPITEWPMENEFQSTLVELDTTRKAMAEANGIPQKPKKEDASQFIGEVIAGEPIATSNAVISARAAFHGGPALFDEFSSDYIGTGEGAAAFGYGIYFAENVNVAEGYARTLAKKAPTITSKWVIQPVDSAQAKYKDLLNYADAAPMLISETLLNLQATPRNASNIIRDLAKTAKKPEYIKAYNGIADMIDSREIVVSIPKGYLYQVSLDVDDNELLDWDAPLSEQSPKVQAALQSVQVDNWLWEETISEKLGTNIVGAAIYKNLTATWPDAEFTADGIDPKKKASEALLAAGIQGIKYLDGDSRVGFGKVTLKATVWKMFAEGYWVAQDGAGNRLVKGTEEEARKAAEDYDAKKETAGNEPTRNLVIFDDSKIKIVSKNGRKTSLAQINARAAKLKSDVSDYLFSNGTVNLEEATNEVALQLSKVAELADAANYAQAEMFDGVATPTKKRKLKEVGNTEYDNLVKAGFEGDWVALAKAINIKGTASSILPELISGKLPVWEIIGTKIEGPEDVAATLIPLRSPYFESVKVAVMDDYNKVISSDVISIGTINETMMHSREVFRALAKIRLATGKRFTRIIISHNHPSGDPTPSAADRRITKNISEAASAVGFVVLDHVITNGSSYFSFKEAGFSFGTPAKEEKGIFGTRDKGIKAPPFVPSTAPWEKVSRDGLQRIDGLQNKETKKLINALRQGNLTAGHALLLTAKNKLTAVERIPSFMDTPTDDVFRQIMMSASVNGAYGFIIQAPFSMLSADFDRFVTKAKEFAFLSQITLLDVLTVEGSSGSMFSANEAGLLAEDPQSNLTLAESTAAPSAAGPIYSEDYTGPRFTYGLRNRPLDIGTAPKGYIIGSNGPAVGRARWGTIQYPRQLTKDEIYDYELEVMDETPATSETTAEDQQSTIGALPFYESPDAFPSIRNARTKKEIADALAAVKKQAKGFGFAKDDIFVKGAEILAERRLSEIIAPTNAEFGFAKEIDAPIEKIKRSMVRFASGMSGLSDLGNSTYVRGGLKNYGVGFDVGMLSKNAIDLLADRVINLDTQVFVDSGAFSHFVKNEKLKAKGKETLAPLDFDKIFKKYDAITEAIFEQNKVEADYPRPLFVMPDIVGDQRASLLLAEQYKDRIALAGDFNLFEPIIPIPLGELSISQAYSKIIEILKTNTLGIEIDPAKFIVGIPSNAEAVSREQLAEFLRESKPPRIHFLGAAADSNINPLLAVVAKAAPDAIVTADASKVRSEILNGVAAGKTREQAIIDALNQEDDPEVVLNGLAEGVLASEVRSDAATMPASIFASTTGYKPSHILRLKKDKWAEDGFPLAYGIKMVDELYNAGSFAGIPEDAVLVAQPSTSGKNILPYLLAQRISADQGNPVFETPVATATAKLEAKKKRYDYTMTIDDPIGYAPEAGLQSLAALNRPVVIVEDVHNTGESWMAFAGLLRRNGVNVSGVAVLNAVETRKTSARDIERVSEKIAASTNEPLDIVKPVMQGFLHGSYKQLANKIELASTNKDKAKRILDHARQRAGAVGIEAGIGLETSFLDGSTESRIGNQNNLVQGQLLARNAARAGQLQFMPDGMMDDDILFSVPLGESIGLDAALKRVPQYSKYHDLAQFLLKQKWAHLKDEKVRMIKPSDLKKNNRRAFRSSGGGEIIHGVQGISTQALLHEAAHSISVDAIKKFIDQVNVSGADYKKLLENVLKNEAAPQPIKDIIKLYFSAAEQLGIQKSMFGSTTKRVNVQSENIGFERSNFDDGIVFADLDVRGTKFAKNWEPRAYVNEKGNSAFGRKPQYTTLEVFKELYPNFYKKLVDNNLPMPTISENDYIYGRIVFSDADFQKILDSSPTPGENKFNAVVNSLLEKYAGTTLPDIFDKITKQEKEGLKKAARETQLLKVSPLNFFHKGLGRNVSRSFLFINYKEPRIATSKTKGYAGPNPDIFQKKVEDSAIKTFSNEAYGMSNIYEFIAQSFSSPEFQIMLSKLKGNKKKTIWQELVEAIKKLFKKMSSDFSGELETMLESVLRTTAEIADLNLRKNSSAKKQKTIELFFALKNILPYEPSAKLTWINGTEDTDSPQVLVLSGENGSYFRTPVKTTSQLIEIVGKELSKQMLSGENLTIENGNRIHALPVSQIDPAFYAKIPNRVYTLNEFLEAANDIGIQEFSDLAKARKPTIGKKPQSSQMIGTPISKGFSAGNSINDIAFDYVAKRSPRGNAMETLVAKEDPSENIALGMAFDNFTSDLKKESAATGNITPRQINAAPTPADEIAIISEEANAAKSFRKNEAKLATENASMKESAKEFYANVFQGRYDKLEYYAPGAKDVILSNKRNETLAAATINAMMDQIKQDIIKGFGYPQFWSKNKTRLTNFLDEILPTAARLEVAGFDDDGNFIFRDFYMRSGMMSKNETRLRGIAPGDTFIGKDGMTYRLGRFVEDRNKYVIERWMPAASQEKIFADFHSKYPETAYYLDRFIAPGMEESRYEGPSGTMTAEFNRGSLRQLFNDWPQELRDLFGPIPLEDMPYVPGYTPDVAEQKTLVALISSLLSKFKSGARKFKAGELRESGNIKNLFDGFSTRAYEAHREKIRVQTRQKLIDLAAKPETSIDPLKVKDFVPLDGTFNQLLQAVKLAQRLNPTAYPALTDALSPADDKAMAKILGDAYRLKGRGLMIHKQVARELMLGVARETTSNWLTRILSGLLERYNGGLLSTPFTAITNALSNELHKFTRAFNRLNFALISAATGDVRGAKLGAYEFGFLLRGLVSDRFMGSKFQQNRIGDIVPKELFSDQTGLEAMDIDADKTVFEQVMRLNLGGAALQAMGYGEIDTKNKQQLAYAAYRAHAEVAWSEAKKRKEVTKQINKREWMRAWMKSEDNGIHQDVYQTVVLYMMDYQNVPAWLDASQSMTTGSKVIKRLVLPFAKWPYNMARQFKVFTVDSAIDLLGTNKSKQQRIEGMANLMTMAGLVALGATVIGMGEGEEEKILGTNIDEEGNVLDAAFRTANRMNISRLARVIFAHGLMHDVDFTLDDGTGTTKDLWWRYRNYPYLKEALALGLVANGQYSEAMQQMGDIAGEYVSLGIISKIIGISEFDKNKPVGYRLTEGALDFSTSGVLPVPWRNLATRLVDPVTRSDKPMEKLGYTASPMDALFNNTPFLSKNQPSTGSRVNAAFAPFSAEKWLNRELAKINKSNMSGSERDAEIRRVKETARRYDIPIEGQIRVMKDAGVPVEKLNLGKNSSVPIAYNIQKLKNMGVGKESIALTPKGEVNMPDASTVAYTDPLMQLIRTFGGVNIKPVPRGGPKSAQITPQEKLFEK